MMFFSAYYPNNVAENFSFLIDALRRTAAPLPLQVLPAERVLPVAGSQRHRPRRHGREDQGLRLEPPQVRTGKPWKIAECNGETGACLQFLFLPTEMPQSGN
jgi:hypothetical protein